MPAISTSSKVLLTGGSGFLGAWILKDLLERGFKVRAAVRSESKAAYLRNLFKDHSENLEFVIIEDIATPGAFDEAIKGINGIIHTASPTSGLTPDIDAKAVIEPAVQGTVGILKSAQNSSVERVVITSSVVAQMDLSKSNPVTYTESDWNDPAIKAVEEQGNAAPVFFKYAASKALAERAALQLVKESNTQFDMVTILPSSLWGQIIHDTTFNTTESNNRLLSSLKKTEQENIKPEGLLNELQPVDIRDAAKVHVDALILPAAGGERITATAGPVPIQRIYNILNANPVEGLEVIRGDPDVLKDWAPKVSFSNQKSKDVLGMEYRTIEETVRNTVTHALAGGWKR